MRELFNTTDCKAPRRHFMGTEGEARILFVLDSRALTAKQLVWLLRLDRSTVGRLLKKLRREGRVSPRRMETDTVWLRQPEALPQNPINLEQTFLTTLHHD